MMAIRLPPDIESRLDTLAKNTGRTKTFYAREAILRHLEDMEDTYIAVQRLENPGRRWTMAEVREKFDLGN